MNDVVPPTVCSTDADCISAASPSDRYCAQGVCMDAGSCASDSDCVNPMHLFDDKRCMGYLTCTEEGLCDRVCGEMCKNGSPGTGCPSPTGCDSRIRCMGAVSCVPDSCNECEAVYYDAAGSAITDCTGGNNQEDRKE